MSIGRRGAALALAAVLLVAFSPVTTAASAAAAPAAGTDAAIAGAAAATPSTSTGPAAADVDRRLLVTLDPAAGAAARSALGVGSATVWPVSTNVLLVEAAHSADATRLLERLVADPAVAHVQRDEVIEAHGAMPAQAQPGADAPLSDDPLLGEQWALRNTGQTIEGRAGVPGIDVRAAEAWTRTRGRRDVVVAVIDSGIDLGHRDLAGQLWVNPRAGTRRQGCNGQHYHHDTHGWNFTRGDADLTDTDGHGTAVASILSAKADDGFGMAGLAPGVRLMVLRTFQNTLTGGLSSSLTDLVCAVGYAADHGADLINASWVTYRDSPALRAVIADAGIPVIAAAGNDSRDPNRDPWEPVAYPAGFGLPHVVGVTAIDNQGGVPRFANTDRTRILLGAPGTAITVAALDGAHRIERGTSFSAPFVTAALALAMSDAPYASTGDLIDTLERTTRPLASLASTTMSGGMLDAGTLLHEVQRPICRPDRVGSVTFSDVHPDSVHAASIACLVEQGIAAGRRDGSYGPATEVSRAQLATFLARIVDAAGRLPDGAPDAFVDDDGSVHEPAIDALAALGIVRGDSERRFRPDAPVRRDQLASMMVRTHEVLTGAPPAPSRAWFQDTQGSVHQRAIDTARDLGTVRGVERGRFSPAAPARRDHVASFLARMLDALARAGVTLQG
jgi:serine protease